MIFQSDLSKRKHRTFYSNKSQVNLLLRHHEGSSGGCYSFMRPIGSNDHVKRQLDAIRLSARLNKIRL